MLLLETAAKTRLSWGKTQTVIYENVRQRDYYVRDEDEMRNEDAPQRSLCLHRRFSSSNAARRPGGFAGG